MGGRSGQILRIYLLQTAMLGSERQPAGDRASGTLVERVFPLLIARYFSIRPAWRLDPVPAIQGLLIGLAVTLLFTLPPLLRIRDIRPTVIFRRDMPEARPGWRERLTRVARLARGRRAAGRRDGPDHRLARASRGAPRACSWAGAVVCLAVMSGVAWAAARLAPKCCWAGSGGVCRSPCATAWPTSTARATMPARCWWRSAPA